MFTPPHHPFEQVTLPLELLRVRPDILHSPDFIPPFRRWFKSVITVHDLGFLRYPESVTEESRRYYGQVARAVRSAQRTIAVSDFTRSDLIELVDAPADRVSVVHNGVDPWFRPVDDRDQLSSLRSRLGLDRPYLLFVGTLEPRKNLPTLLHAFRQVRARHDLLLALVGRRGWLWEPIVQEIQALGIEASVRQLDGIPDSDLPALYSAAAAFSYPSLYEGFGLPPLESLACGTPTVVADTSSLPEVVGDAALLHPPTDVDALADALLRLIEDETLRATLSKRGLARAARFTWEEAVRRTLAVYEEALAA